MTRTQYRAGTADQWTAGNPVLEVAEIGYEQDTLKMKIGDGITPWIELPYMGENTGVGGTNPIGPAGGDLTGAYPSPQIKSNTIVAADVNTAYKDGLATTPSLRTLGSGANQAAPGNDVRFESSAVIWEDVGTDTGTIPTGSLIHVQLAVGETFWITDSLGNMLFSVDETGKVSVG